MLLHHRFADRRIGFEAKTSVQIVFAWKETKIREEHDAGDELCRIRARNPAGQGFTQASFYAEYDLWQVACIVWGVRGGNKECLPDGPVMKRVGLWIRNWGAGQLGVTY